MGGVVPNRGWGGNGEGGVDEVGEAGVVVEAGDAERGQAEQLYRRLGMETCEHQRESNRI